MSETVELPDLDSLPLIGVTACVRDIGAHAFHVAGDKYLLAAAAGAGGLPVIVPALGQRLDPAALVARLDGLLITGSPSNVDPAHYGGPASADGTLHDPARDLTTLPLIRQALAADLPVLAICRGHQELNVALGGSLHQRLQELPGRQDHRSDPADPADRQYAPVHPVDLTPGGVLAGLAGAATLQVNSLHAQGIDRLAARLVVEATAPDGTIEAVRVAGAGFALGIQWHPEWRFADSPFGLALFAAFGAAARARRRSRLAAERGLGRPA